MENPNIYQDQSIVQTADETGPLMTEIKEVTYIGEPPETNLAEYHENEEKPQGGFTKDEMVAIYDREELKMPLEYITQPSELPLDTTYNEYKTVKQDVNAGFDGTGHAKNLSEARIFNTKIPKGCQDTSDVTFGNEGVHVPGTGIPQEFSKETSINKTSATDIPILVEDTKIASYNNANFDGVNHAKDLLHTNIYGTKIPPGCQDTSDPTFGKLSDIHIPGTGVPMKKSHAVERPTYVSDVMVETHEVTKPVNNANILPVSETRYVEETDNFDDTIEVMQTTTFEPNSRNKERSSHDNIDYPKEINQKTYRVDDVPANKSQSMHNKSSAVTPSAANINVSENIPDTSSYHIRESVGSSRPETSLSDSRPVRRMQSLNKAHKNKFPVAPKSRPVVAATSVVPPRDDNPIFDKNTSFRVTPVVSKAANSRQDFKGIDNNKSDIDSIELYRSEFSEFSDEPLIEDLRSRSPTSLDSADLLGSKTAVKSLMVKDMNSPRKQKSKPKRSTSKNPNNNKISYIHTVTVKPISKQAESSVPKIREITDESPEAESGMDPTIGVKHGAAVAAAFTAMDQPVNQESSMPKRKSITQERNSTRYDSIERPVGFRGEGLDPAQIKGVKKQPSAEYRHALKQQTAKPKQQQMEYKNDLKQQAAKYNQMPSSEFAETNSNTQSKNKSKVSPSRKKSTSSGGSRRPSHTIEVANPEELSRRPSLIDPNTPTYGFKEEKHEEYTTTTRTADNSVTTERRKSSYLRESTIPRGMKDDDGIQNSKIIGPSSNKVDAPVSHHQPGRNGDESFNDGEEEEQEEQEQEEEAPGLFQKLKNTITMSS